MEQQKFIRCPKYTYQKLPFQIKLQIVHKVTNGQISVNHSAVAIFIYSISVVPDWEGFLVMKKSEKFKP